MKTIFITGATSGIGLVAAMKLASDGNLVLATARNKQKGIVLLSKYNSQFPKGKGKIEIVICDLDSFESVVEACEYVKSNYTCIDVLINNAGVWNYTFKKTQNNLEETLQVNVLSPLLINYLLLDLLSQSKNAKSIFTASALHQGNVDFSNMEHKRHFSGFAAYRQSKLEVILISRILAEKFQPLHIGVYSQHPGLVSTNLDRNSNWFSKFVFRVFGLSPEKGAATLLYLANEDKNNLVSGEYYYKKAVKKTTPESNDLFVAQKLLNKLVVYLHGYLSHASVIFKK